MFPIDRVKHDKQKKGRVAALLRKSRRFLLHDCKSKKASHTSLRRYWQDFCKKHQQTSKRIYYEDRLEYGRKCAEKTATKAEKNGHCPVVCNFPWDNTRTHGQFAVICKSCQLPLFRQYCRNAKKRCLGAKARTLNCPTPRFWKVVGEHKLQKKVQQLLDFTEEEIQMAVCRNEQWKHRSWLKKAKNEQQKLLKCDGYLTSASWWDGCNRGRSLFRLVGEWRAPAGRCTGLRGGVLGHWTCR